MACTTSWTQRAALLLPVLLLVLLVCDAASAAVVRGQRTHAANDEAYTGSLNALNPLALLVLRAMASDDAAAPAAVLDPMASNDDMAGLEAAVSSARASPSRAFTALAAAAPDGDMGDTAFLRTAKRQVRYHQCYFNPISCFG
ncbi:uncharacterized protein LOC117645960 [Thrips palmi]|uniref:Uncharacterized protein LOC117645960 n=1 Tax=Thrips palmi TaxID=161013 RepID=A0A6P8YYS5_THRPL|nr:uncharacterized protein LOC117645960 [Thrips palmi]